MLLLERGGLQPLVAMSSFYVGCGDPNSGPTVYGQVPYSPSHVSNPRNGLSLAIWDFLNQVRLREPTHHLPRGGLHSWARAAQNHPSTPPHAVDHLKTPQEVAGNPGHRLMWAVTMESRVQRRDRNTSFPLSSAYVILKLHTTNKRSGHFLLPEDTVCSVDTESSASPFCC